jgi:hypothetical protein
MNERNLLSPGGAAQRLKLTRQAVEQSGNAPGGRLLLWAFGYPGRRAAETYIDFGERRPPYGNPRPEWAEQWRGRDPAQLLDEARERYRLELARPPQEAPR